MAMQFKMLGVISFWTWAFRSLLPICSPKMIVPTLHSPRLVSDLVQRTSRQWTISSRRRTLSARASPLFFPLFFQLNTIPLLFLFPSLPRLPFLLLLRLSTTNPVFHHIHHGVLLFNTRSPLTNFAPLSSSRTFRPTS